MSQIQTKPGPNTPKTHDNPFAHLGNNGGYDGFDPSWEAKDVSKNPTGTRLPKPGFQVPLACLIRWHDQKLEIKSKVMDFSRFFF